jgi:predicted nuclease with TOPRIM domain
VANKMILERLELINFKGVKSFVLETNNGNTKVYGDNATGKTTLFDAFIWLLFDKDSQNKKEFSLKTLEDGKEVHYLDHEVNGSFWIDGKRVTLRKVYSEKWTKKRGSATSEFGGHTTEYYIDDIPSKKKEYVDFIDSITKEEVFKLLTSPSYFNEQVKKLDRRKTLVEVAGDLTEEEIISSNPALENVPAILQGKTVEEHKAKIAVKQKKINDELKIIPVRIGEVQRGLPDLNGLNKLQLENDVELINQNIDEKMTLINSIRNGKSVTDKQMKIQEIDMQLIDIQRNHDMNSKDSLYKLKARLQEEQSNVSIIQSKIDSLRISKKYNDDSINKLTQEVLSLRGHWNEINDQLFEHNDKCECPTCGQALPQEQVDEARNKALASFNLNKATKLEEITAKGQQLNKRIEGLAKENEALEIQYQKLNSQIEEKQATIGNLQEQINLNENSLTDILDNPEYVAKLKEKQAIQQEMKDIQEMAEENIQSIQVEIVELKAKREAVQADIGKFASVIQSQKRIDELMEQEKELATEYERLEEELYLTEEYIKTKINLLEEKINGRFKYARFNLFKTNINGGLEEICETTFNGVPYSSGLNNAAKINVGLDIINTLSEHYGFSAPIFIDNSEAVTKLIETEAQTISLVVSETDKALRVLASNESSYQEVI